MPAASVFVDTNVFVYARQAHEAAKQPVAAQWIDRLWREQTGRTSMQVLSECYVTMTRRLKPAPSSAAVWDYVRSLLAWHPQPVDAQVFHRAFEIEQRHQLNWWDCLIVGSAQLQGCSVLLSEDLQDGAVLGSVTVRNPFALSVSDQLAAYQPGAVEMPSHPRRGRPKRAARPFARQARSRA
jgi:predicted nucleic acid-binding protein